MCGLPRGHRIARGEGPDPAKLPAPSLPSEAQRERMISTQNAKGPESPDQCWDEHQDSGRKEGGWIMAYPHHLITCLKMYSNYK